MTIKPFCTGGNLLMILFDPIGIFQGTGHGPRKTPPLCPLAAALAPQKGGQQLLCPWRTTLLLLGFHERSASFWGLL